VSKIFLGSLALAMKDRKTGKGKEGRGGRREGIGGEEGGREGKGREGMEMGEVCFMVLGGSYLGNALRHSHEIWNSIQGINFYSLFRA
jgi:hypothetical protein